MTVTGGSSIPMLEREAGSIVAVHGGRPISAEQFLAEAMALASQLPESAHVINLVGDRYGFTLGLVGAALRGQCTILPPNAKLASQTSILEAYPHLYVLHDGATVADGMREHTLIPSTLVGVTSVSKPWPRVERSRIAAISFTSGSTGQATPIAKSWNMFYAAVELYSKTLIPAPANVVATVPAQHMYGLELTALMALWQSITITPGKPLFPRDIQTELECIEAPRILITTPLHLRALLESNVKLPTIERVLSATAVLSVELASTFEAKTGARVIDVYGCSELGCLAARRLSRQQRWKAFEPFRFVAEHGATRVEAAHLDNGVVLQDRLEFSADGTFMLVGRLGDMVKVGGKRGSLGELTRLLLQVPGVVDGIVFDPEEDSVNDARRLAAIYAGSASRADIRRHMGAQVDAVLIPRPIIQVEYMPRTDTSKLPRERLLKLYASHRGH